MTDLHPKPVAPRKRRLGVHVALGAVFLCCAIALLAACETSPEPTPEPPQPAIQDPRWVDAAIEAGFPSDLVPWLADPRNRGELPSSPDLRTRYVNAFVDITGLDRRRFLVLGLGWQHEDYERFDAEYLSPAPTPIPWQKQWLAHSEGGANGVIGAATAVRGRPNGADLWIKCYEDIRSTEVEILFRFTDIARFAGDRFEATAEAVTRLGPADPTAVIATAVAVDEENRDVPMVDLLSAARAATAEAAHTSATAEAERVARARELIATAGASRSDEARSAYAIVENIHRAARAAEESIDQIFISRRAAGETGRWMKSGWKHHSETVGHMVLQQALAAGFIQQLAEVEEFAVLVTHDFGEDTAAVFDVRHLDAALASLVVGWDC